jgi:lipopolysaccharide export system permease protein
VTPQQPARPQKRLPHQFGWQDARAPLKLPLMRLHDRYFFRELITPLAFCLGGFSVLWLADFFFTKIGEMQEHKFQLRDGVEYFLALSPEFFVLALPIALLLALLYALTQHARHNELTALRAAGVSLGRLCGPYFIVGFFASLLLFGVNEIAVPRSAKWAEAILARHVPQVADPQAQTIFTKVAFRNARANRLWEIGQYDSGTVTMVNPSVTWTLPDGSWKAVSADRAEWTKSVWVFYNAKLFAQTGTRGHLLPVSTTNILALPEFDETPRLILSEIKFTDARSLRASRSADIPLAEIWEYLKIHPQLEGEDAHWLLTKFHGRLAAPWTCLVVVLIAIPFGAVSGRRNLFVGVAGSIFICFAFFILQNVGLALGEGGHLPGWLAAWLPNLFFAALGLGLMLRAR